MKSLKSKTGIVVYEVLIVLVVILIIGSLVGWQGLRTSFNSWFAEAYGSDWLVVSYTATGKPLNVWELKNISVKSEKGSDGIYFIDNSSNVVHISAPYMYIQVTDWNAARKKYLKGEL